MPTSGAATAGRSRPSATSPARRWRRCCTTGVRSPSLPARRLRVLSRCRARELGQTLPAVELEEPVGLRPHLLDGYVVVARVSELTEALDVRLDPLVADDRLGDVILRHARRGL